ncbi:hypothetical protein F7725_015156, partial [Dissostichus mawsoni]
MAAVKVEAACRALDVEKLCKKIEDIPELNETVSQSLQKDLTGVMEIAQKREDRAVVQAENKQDDDMMENSERFTELQGKYDALQKTSETYEVKNHCLQMDFNTFRAKCKLLNHKIDIIQEDKDVLEPQLNELRENFRTIHYESRVHRQQNYRLAQDNRIVTAKQVPLQAQNTTLNEEKGVLLTNAKVLRHQCLACGTNQEALQAELVTNKQDIKRLRKCCNSLCKQNGPLLDQFKTFQAQNTILLENMKLLPNNSHGLQTQNDGPQENVRSLQTQNDGPQENLRSLQTQNDGPQKNLRSLQTQNDGPQENVSAPFSDTPHVLQGYNNMHQEGHGRERWTAREILKYRAEINGHQENIEVLQMQNNGLQEDIKTVREQINGLEENVGTLREQNSGLQEDDKTLWGQNIGLQEIVRTLQGQHDGLQEEMIRLQAENNELKVNGKIITVEAQNDGLKENLQTLQAQNNGLQVQVKTLETQIKGLQQDIRTLQGQRSGLGGVVNFEKAQENRNVLQETESNLLANPISKKRRAK